MGPVPAQPRRADAGNGHRRGARLHVPHLRPRSAGPHQPRHPPPPGAAAGKPSRQDRADERPAASRCRARRSSTTATRSAWATTSISATATASARRCSGAATATPASRAPIRSGCTCRSSSTRHITTSASTSRPSRINPHSLLWWMKRLIALRKRYQAFGRGSLEFIAVRQSQGAGVRAPLPGRKHAGGRQPVAFRAVRRTGPERVRGAWCRSRSLGRTRFPAVGPQPYFLTLPGYSFYWFCLERPRATGAAPVTEAEPITLRSDGPMGVDPGGHCPERTGTGPERIPADAVPGFRDRIASSTRQRFRKRSAPHARTARPTSRWWRSRTPRAIRKPTSCRWRSSWASAPSCSARSSRKP